MTSSEPEMPSGHAEPADAPGPPDLALQAQSDLALQAQSDLALQAETEAAAAEERAEAARARAEELRRQLRAEDRETPGHDAPADSAAGAGRPSVPLRTVALVLATLLTMGLLSLTGFMVWQHREHTEQRQRAAEYAAAARQGVINLMSIDYATAQDSVQRVLDGSTGKFRANFADTAEDFVKALKDEKITTKATVNDAAVESMTADSAVVMVSATSRREGPQAPKDQQQPRLWRVVLTLERDGDQIKMSGVEFV
jgi:Mce-associated membrane protein